ncbi:MAG: hypothetical protein U0794_16385 [Isosphaeraceae bacterium]
MLEAIRVASGKVVDQDEYEGQCSMYHIPDPSQFLRAALPELSRRAVDSGVRCPWNSA